MATVTPSRNGMMVVYQSGDSYSMRFNSAMRVVRCVRWVGLQVRIAGHVASLPFHSVLSVMNSPPCARASEAMRAARG